jgi:hypothetical protein
LNAPVQIVYGRLWVHIAVPAASIHHDTCHHLALCVHINAMVTYLLSENGFYTMKRAIPRTDILCLDDLHLGTRGPDF